MQISIDTLSDNIAHKLLHVNPGYTSCIKEMLRNANDLGVDFQIATVLTNINDSIDNLEELYEFLKGLDRLRRWDVRIAFRSLYSKSDFDKIKSSRRSIEEVAAWVADRCDKSAFKISWSPDDDKKYKKAKGGSRNFEGAICSANNVQYMVLPDGKCDNLRTALLESGIYYRQCILRFYFINMDFCKSAEFVEKAP